MPAPTRSLARRSRGALGALTRPRESTSGPATRPFGAWRRSPCRTYRPEILGDISAFAGFFRILAGYRDPVFVASTDGVGSTLRVAFLAGRHDTVGIDLVAMSVNDLPLTGLLLE